MRSLLVCMVGVLSVGPAPAASPPPNIIYVMVDDMGPADAGCFGSTAIHTPHLDRMAEQGLHFTQAYSGCTVCAPCRSVLLTGIHMGRTSVRPNTGGVPLLDQDVTVAEVLKQAGYRCGGFGKWGVGDIGTDGVPEKQGFDLFYGYYHQIHAHSHWPAFLVRNGVKEPNEPRQAGTRQGYAPDKIFHEMKQFIIEAAQDGHPFFAYGPWTPPHGGYTFPADDSIWALYQGRDGWSDEEKGAAAMTTLVDRYMGEVVECPGAYDFPQPAVGAILLGELVVDIRGAVTAGEQCVVTGWEIRHDGRKHFTGTALFGESGACCAVGYATWFQVAAKPV